MLKIAQNKEQNYKYTQNPKTSVGKQLNKRSFNDYKSEYVGFKMKIVRSRNRFQFVRLRNQVDFEMYVFARHVEFELNV